MASISRTSLFLPPYRALWSFAAVLLAVACAVPSALAQSRGVAIVRDAEIEQLVREYARPILKAGGLANSGIEIILVNDNSFNAFVTGRRMFIHTGALLAAETPNEIIGVIAHEAGHIVGGHQFRLRERIDAAKTLATMSSLLGVGAIAAGAATRSTELGQIGTGIVAGGGELARRGVLAYQRDEERAADRTALELLNRTGQSGAGMLITLERLARDLKLNAVRINPYQVSHPLPAERVETLRDAVLAAPSFPALDSPALQARHDLMRAKIAAYTQGPNAVRRLFPDRGSLPARYGDAISTHLSGNPAAAVKKAQDLISARPQNPHFQELLGEALMRANKPEEAAAAFARAAKLAAGSGPMIRIEQARALIAAGKPRDALKLLQTAMQYERMNANGHAAMAQAHAALGETGEAELATAEMHFVQGRILDAQTFAIRAQGKLAQGSPEWQRAQDIISAKRQQD